MTRVITARRYHLAPVVLLLGGLLVGCGTSGPSSSAQRPSSSAPIPTSAITPPAGVELTLPGAALRFGQPATVGFAQNAGRRTTLRITVASVRRGAIADVAAYALDDTTRTATPFYATVSITNVGGGDVSRAAVPVRAVASDGTLVASSNFTTPLATCPSSALPAPFARGATAQTCLVYLLPQGTTLTRMSFQPLSSDRAITWEGAVAVPKATRKPRATASPAR